MIWNIDTLHQPQKSLFRRIWFMAFMLDKRFVVMCGYVPLAIFGRWQIFLTKLLWTEASGVEVNLWSVACVSWNNRMEMTLKPGTLGDWCIPEVYQLMRVLQRFMWNFIILTLKKRLWDRWCLWIFFQVRAGWRGGCRILVAFALTVIYRNFMYNFWKQSTVLCVIHESYGIELGNKEWNQSLYHPSTSFPLIPTHSVSTGNSL